MKITTTLFALFTAAFGCATDEAPEDATTDRDVITDSRPDIEESFEISAQGERALEHDPARRVWAEVIEIDNVRTTRLHQLDVNGIDTIEVLDEDGVVLRAIETR